MADRHVREPVQRAAGDRGLPELPERPRGRVDHGHIIVGPELHEGCDEGRRPAVACEHRGNLGGAPPDRGLGVADGATPGVKGAVRSSHAHERAERGGSGPRVGIVAHGIGEAGLDRSRRRVFERNRGERCGPGHGVVVNLHPRPLPAPHDFLPPRSQHSGAGGHCFSDLGLEDRTFRAEATGVRGLGTWLRAAVGLVLVAASTGAGVVALGPRTSALDRPLFEGVWLTVIDRGPAHWPGTAEPGGWGNVVVAAHRTTHGGPFGRIGELVSGNEIMLRDTHGTFTYVVTGSEVVTPLDMWIIDQHPGRTITLFACHPIGSAAERLVVHGELVSAHEF